MQRVTLCVITLCIILQIFLCTFVFADPQDNSYSLEQVQLCLGQDSVQLYADEAVLHRYPNLTEELFDRLLTNLKLTLQGSSLNLVVHDAPSSCEGASGYVLMTLYLYYLDPEIYKEFKGETLSYALYLQVGEYAPKTYLLTHYTLPQTHFIQFKEDVYSLTPNTTWLGYFSKTTTPFVLELAAAWWDDNPRPPKKSYLPHLLGLLLTLGVVSLLRKRF